MSGAWIAVACAAHVRRGREGGFMQVCHGKPGPLRRIRPGDGVLYYSPTETMGGREPCRAFTAAGIVAPGEPYRVEMAPDFHPWRRDVAWMATRAVPIAPLLPELGFGRDWGWRLRFGLLAIGREEFALVAAAMGADHPSSAAPIAPPPARTQSGL